jgi:uroporphyrinogen-III synthase
VERPIDDLPGIGNLDIDIIPFTSINLGLDQQTEEQVRKTATEIAAVVFTSSNAIRSIIRYIDNDTPPWTIYCIGNTTFELAKEIFGAEKIRQTAPNASALAEKIIADSDQHEVVFFCGNLRRNDLPGALREKNIAVREIIVYQTTLTPTKLEKEYDAILFFSPSSAESFFSMNKVSPKTVLFVMGQTTSRAIQKHAENRIITGREPDKYQLIIKAASYVRENSLSH